MRGRSPPNPGWKFEDYHLPVLLRAFGAARRHLQLQHPTGISWKITRARMLSMGLNGESTNEMMDIQQYTVSSSWPHCRRKTIDDQFQASIGTSSHMNVPTKPPMTKDTQRWCLLVFTMKHHTFERRRKRAEIADVVMWLDKDWQCWGTGLGSSWSSAPFC